ncbi:MAG: type II secretion system F family protein [bacterium]|nr:type II secretion system F family protein [bacterium]
MEQYTYLVKDDKGLTKQGIIEAADPRAASAILHERGFVVISIEEKSKALAFSFFKGVSLSVQANFTRQLATMITSGLPLSDSLVVLKKQTENQKMLEIITNIADDIQAGSTFSAALAKHADVFSAAYINIVKAGEASGTLDKVLQDLADNLEKEREFQGKVKGAFVYPVIILIAMALVTGIIMIFVVPKLTDLYVGLNISLPLPTLILIGLSKFLATFWWLLILVIVGLVIAYRRYRRTPQGALVIDRILMRLPVMGKLNRETSLTELTRTLGALVAAGVPILEALKISGEVATNAIHRQAVKRSATLVEKGAALSKAMAQEPEFPAILPQMVAVGEETGKMDDVLGKLSHYFEVEVEQQVKNLTTALEPIIMVVLGIMVGLLVISIILPIYSITSAF